MWALLLEATHPRLATDVHYVAGDRVVADPLCKPFSMGRNLFCVHSKKHLDDEPALKEQKVRTNRQTLVSMARELNEVGCHGFACPLLLLEDLQGLQRMPRHTTVTKHWSAPNLHICLLPQCSVPDVYHHPHLHCLLWVGQ